jgi:hypothetical protein
MPASSYLRGKLIDESLRAANYVPPTTVYVALHTADPTINALPATEVGAAWYGRQVVTFGAQITAGQTANDAIVTFNAVNDGVITITHFSVWDAPTLGNMLYYGALASAKTFANTDVPSFLTGQIVVTAS